MTRYYCGIDVGKTGCAAILNESLDLVALLPLSRQKDGRGSEKDFVDPMMLVKSIEQKVSVPRSVSFFVEDQFRNKSTLTDLGSILAACAVFKERNPASLNHDITRVPARTWMTKLGVTSDKKTHLAYTRQYFDEKDLPKLTHDQADAINIALYGMMLKADLLLKELGSEEEE